MAQMKERSRSPRVCIRQSRYPIARAQRFLLIAFESRETVEWKQRAFEWSFPILPAVLADFSPAAQFYKVEAVIRPWRLKFVCRVSEHDIFFCIAPQMFQQNHKGKYVTCLSITKRAGLLANHPLNNGGCSSSIAYLNALSVLQELLEAGIRGVTVTEVRGFGAQGGSRERQAGKG